MRVIASMVIFKGFFLTITAVYYAICNESLSAKAPIGQNYQISTR